MEWIDRFNDALNYVEDNLDAELSLTRAAQAAACSEYHFQRMFAYLAGVTFGVYVRRRRMTAAAFELTGGGAKVIDLAAKYGYESPTAFNRAFQSVHGVPPSAARAEGIRLSASSQSGCPPRATSTPPRRTSRSIWRGTRAPRTTAARSGYPSSRSKA